MTDATTAAGRERPQTRRRKSLSDKQLAILEVIQRSIARHGYPPSMREIGDAVGLKSLSSVTHQLNQLELSGYLRRDPGKTRAMEVLIDLPGTAAENPADTAPAVGDAALVPLVGRIAAGVPITADQQVEEIFPLPRQLVGKGELFMLKVSGDSMIDAAICDGDWVVHRRERRDRCGHVGRRGHRQGLPSPRRPHVAPPPQLRVRTDPGRRGHRPRPRRGGPAYGVTCDGAAGGRMHASRRASGLRRSGPVSTGV